MSNMGGHMRSGRRLIAGLLLALCLVIPAVLMSGIAEGAARTASVSGNWSSTTTWGGSAVPTSADAVTISSGITVTVDVPASCLSVTINAASTANGITISGTNTLTVSGTITMNFPTAAVASTLAVDTGTLSATSISIAGSHTAKRNTILSVSTGTVTTSGAITFSGTAAQAQLTFTGAGTMNIGGNLGTGGTFTASTSTVNYNGSTQTVGAYAYNNLTLSGGGAKTLQTGTTTIGGNLTLSGTANATMVVGLAITGNLNIGDGTTFTAAGFALTVTGTTTIGAGTSGNLTVSSSTGTKIFTGLVTVNTGGTWNNSGNSAITFRGGITSNPAFTAGSGMQTFDTNSQALTGTFSIPSVTVTGLGIILTNNNSLTVSTALIGTGGLTQAASATLNINGTSTITTLTATDSGNTVNYTGVAQTAKPTIYSNLTVSGSGNKIFATTPNVNGVLSMEGSATVTVTGAAVVTFGGSATLQYDTTTPRTASTEEWITPFAATGGVIIKSTGAITTGGAKVFNAGVALNINSGATLTPGANLLTFNGDFINAGTLTSGSGGTAFTGTATQNIGGFTTTGLVSMTKTAGTATFTGNVTGAGLTINGSGGTLNLGAGLTHTLTGVVTLNAGTLNGGSSVLNENMVSPTAWNGTGTVFSASTGTVNFGAAGAQTLSASSTTFNNLTISGSGTKTLSSNTSVTGDLNVSAGTLDLSTFTANRASTGGTLSVASGATLLTGGAANFPTNYSTVSLGATSTVNYDNAGVQTVSAQSYGNLTLSGSGAKTMTGVTTIGGNLTLSGTATMIGNASLAVTGAFNYGSSGSTTLTATTPVSTGAFNQTSGTLVDNGNTITVTGTGASTWVESGTFTATGTVIFTGAAPQIGISNFNNLTLGGTASVTPTGALTIGGNLTVADSTVFTAAAFALTVTGTTTVGAGTSGILTISSATGTKAFNGDVTVNSGATWNNTATNAALTLPGNLTVNGAFNAGTGVHTFSGTTKTIGGTLSIPSVTVTGTYTNNGTLTVGTLLTVTSPGTLTNNGTLTASTALSGTGRLTQGTTGTLNISGTSGITTLTATASGNTVNYNGSVQTVKATTYNKIALSGSGPKSMATGTSVTGNLSIAPTGTATASVGTGLNLTVNSLTLGGVNQASGTWGSSSSSATHKNDTYFAATTGILTVTTGIGPLDHFAVTTPGTQTAGSSFSITTITAQDTNNNTVTSFTGTVDLTETGGGAGGTVTPSQSSAFTLGVLSGQSVTLSKSGTLVTITVTDHAGTGKTGVSGTFTINASALDHFAVTTPGTQTAGSSFSITTITAQDTNNNTLTSFTGTVDLTETGGGAGGTVTPSQSSAFTLGVLSGQSVTLSKSGTLVTITVTDHAGTGKTGVSGTFTINPGAATRLVITGNGAQTAGASQNLTITTEDSGSNTVTSYTGSKNLTFSGANSSTNPATAPTVKNSSGTAIAFGSTTAISFSSGVATVSGGNNGVMTLYKAEAATISATDGSISSTGGDRLSVMVSAAGMNKFVLSLASPQPNGLAFTGTNTLTAQDAYGNTVGFDASANNVTIAADAPLTGAVSGLSGGNKLTSAGDFSSGVANLTALGMTYTGNATSGTFTTTSADGGYTGTSGSVTIRTTPTITAVGLYQTDRTTAVTAMTPQVEYAVKVSVADAYNLSELTTVVLTIYYDTGGSYNPANIPGSGNTQTAAILTWLVGGSPTWSIDAGTGTTWSIVSADSIQPSLAGTSGDFWFHFKPGKVATAANGKWYVYARATSPSGSGDNHQDSRTMNWYGEISVNSAAVDFGGVAMGSDFSANPLSGISVTYISNGAYSMQVKLSSPWSGDGKAITLNTSGNPGTGEFSVKANGTSSLGSAVVATTGYVAIGTGTQTGESGVASGTHTLWLKLGALGIPAVRYSGTIYYGIAP